MTERMVFEIEFTRDPTVKLTARQLEVLVLKQLLERYAFPRGQQSTLNVEAFTISTSVPERREF